MSATAHLDRYALERLPPRDQWPEFLFDLPELRYPDRLNCGVRLLDDAVADGHGSRIAIYSHARNWTYAQLLDAANRIGNVLTREMGIVPGNRVLLRAPNNPTLAAAWLAVMKAGAIAVTTMPLLRAKELVVIAERAAIDHALCDVRLSEDLSSAARATRRLNRIVYFNGLDCELETLMSHQPAQFSNCATASDDVCLLAFTSGTTGNPKATMHFHRDVMAMTDVVARHLLHTSPDDIYVGTPPLGFTFGLGALLVFPLACRGAAALMERASPENLLDAVQRFRASGLFTAPVMYRNLLAVRSRFDLTSLRHCVSAGEPLPAVVSDDWRKATGLRIIDGIGATEMIHIFISATGEDIRPGSTGKPLPGYRACVLDEHNLPLSPGNIGRLAVKGPTGCRYLDGANQREYVVDGWNVTGDRYLMDGEGYFWFQGRADDMILSSGYNIAGPEVEAALLAHPAVRECAVIGVPDEERGQIVKAFIVAKEGFEADATLARALQEHVKAAIAPYKYPRAVEFIDTLPKTPTGKLQRYALREQEAQRAGRNAR